MAWITGRRVHLRAWERDDVRARWEASQTADSTEARLRDWHVPPRSLHDMESEFDSRTSEPDESVVSLIIEADGRAVGDINLFGIDQRNRSASLGLSVWRGEDRDRGYGSDAISALLRWAFRQLNLHRIELQVDPANARAIHVYEKCGFAHEGRRRDAHFGDGRYHDSLLMGILRHDFEEAEEDRSRAAQQAGAGLP